MIEITMPTFRIQQINKLLKQYANIKKVQLSFTLCHKQWKLPHPRSPRTLAGSLMSKQ